MILPSLTSGEFAFNFNKLMPQIPTSTIPAIVGGTDPDRPANQQTVGTDSDSWGGWVKRVVSAAWDANPLSVSDKVAVPIAQGVNRAGAGAQAALASAGSAIADVGTSVADGVQTVTSYAKWAVVLVVVFGAIYLFSFIAQPLILARSAAK
jgi:hypothetical protein